MICRHCQTQNLDEAKFCMNCGKPLNAACSKCGYENLPQAKFCINCGNQLSAPASTQKNAIQKFIPKEFAEKLESARNSQTMQGERRIVTILFCDVKGSTAMAEQLDPEEWAEIMNQAFEYLISPIYKYEGTLARLMGDSILAFFGAPIAHEDDAQRAILAGLDILNGIRPFREKVLKRYHLDFNLRVGINTGLVVVGGVGSDLFMEYTALGDAINIAARMEQTAQPGTIQIAEDTYKKVAHLYEFEPVEDIAIKGKQTPIKVFRVLGTKEKPGRDRGIQGLESALVGRVGEIKKLKEVLEGVDKGRGHIINLVGEAGLGKSRLLKEICEVWESKAQNRKALGMLPTRWNQVSGISYESSRPYGLVQKLLRNFLGLTTNTSPERVREILREVFSVEGMEGVVDTGLFEVILGVQEQTNGKQLEGEQLKRAIYKEMLTTLDLLIKKGPTVLAIDDLHWSDPASAEFIIHLFQLADRLPILFICAFRPDRASPAWKVKQAAETNYAHRYIEINLSPLSNEESEHLLDCLLIPSELPQEIRQMILQKAEGNPLFLEEIVRTLIENAILLRDAENEAWKVKSSIEQITIPDNLQSLLIARIDRLEETAKHVLQLASVIGRSFYRQILAIISDTANELDGELNNLQRLGLILETGRDPDIRYIFRQALTYETAYNTILLKNRREFHKRVGEAVLDLFSENIDEFAPVLGHHFFEARDQRALQYLKIEGDSAFRLYANLEAIQYFEKAIEVAGWVDNPDLKELEELYICLGRAYELNGQFSKALANYKKLERVGREFDSTAIVLTALIAQTQVHSIPSNEFNIPKGLELLEKSIALAEVENNQATLAKIYWIQTNLLRFHTTLEEAQQVGEKAIALARELGLEEQLAYSLNDTAHAYNMDIQVAKAKEKAVEAVGLWQKLDNQPMLADGLGGLAAICILSGEFDEGYRYSNEAYAISQKIENVWGKSYSRYAVGLVDLKRGDVGLAIRHLDQSRKDAVSANYMAGTILTNSILSAIFTDLGNYQLAIDTLDKFLQDQTENRTLIKGFFLGARTLSLIKDGKIAETEKLIEEEKSLITKSYAFSRLYFQLAQCHLAFGKKDYQAAIQISQEQLSKFRDGGFRLMSADLLILTARAQIALAMWEEAKNTLIEARQLSEKLGARFDLWQIDYYLGHCEETQGNPAKATEFYEMANANLSFVIKHIPTAELIESFKSRSDVAAVLQIEQAKVLEQ